MGASVPDRAGALRAEPQDASQAEPLIPCAEDVANRLSASEVEALLGGKVKGSAKPRLVRRGLLAYVPRKQGPWAQPRFDYVVTEFGMSVAQAIEARRAIDSEAGVVGDESAVPNGNAPK